MDLSPHLHPAAATAAVIAAVVMEALCRASMARRQGAAPQRMLSAWGLGLVFAAASAVVMAEVLARLGIGSWDGGAVGGLALGAGFYAAPGLGEGGWRAPYGLALVACRLAQFAVMGAVIGGLS